MSYLRNDRKMVRQPLLNFIRGISGKDGKIVLFAFMGKFYGMVAVTVSLSKFQNPSL